MAAWREARHDQYGEFWSFARGALFQSHWLTTAKLVSWDLKKKGIYKDKFILKISSNSKLFLALQPQHTKALRGFTLTFSQPTMHNMYIVHIVTSHDTFRNMYNCICKSQYTGHPITHPVFWKASAEAPARRSRASRHWWLWHQTAPQSLSWKSHSTKIFNIAKPEVTLWPVWVVGTEENIAFHVNMTLWNTVCGIKKKKNTAGMRLN